MWALATLSGCLNGAAFVFYGPLSFLANLPLLFALRSARSPLQATALGAWVGALGGFHIFGVLNYGWWIFWAFSLYTASQMMVFGATIYYFRRRLGPRQGHFTRLIYELLVPCLIWTLTEWARTVGPVALPASYVGCIADINWLTPLLGWAQVMGGLGVSALIALVPSAIFMCLTLREQPTKQKVTKTGDIPKSQRPKEGGDQEEPLDYSELRMRANRLIVGMSGIIIVLGLSLWGFLDPPPTEGEPIKLAGVQGGFTNQVYEASLIDPALSVDIIETYEALNAQAKEAQVDLIVWAESVIRVPLISNNTALRERLLPQKESDPWLIGGILHTEPDGRRYNMAISAAAPNMIKGRYIKVKTVPGVEMEFVQGKKWEPLATRWGPIGVLICFEAIYPQAGRELVSLGARLILVLSNDAGFGETPISHHMTNRAAVRAVETGRWLLRVGQAGVTTLFDPRGKAHGRLPSFKADVLYGEAQLRSDVTPYVRFGLTWLWAFVVILGWPMLWSEVWSLLGWWRGKSLAPQPQESAVMTPSKINFWSMRARRGMRWIKDQVISRSGRSKEKPPEPPEDDPYR
jgi:apolipoprotein N-acyltransferase